MPRADPFTGSTRYVPAGTASVTAGCPQLYRLVFVNITSVMTVL